MRQPQDATAVGRDLDRHAFAHAAESVEHVVAEQLEVPGDRSAVAGERSSAATGFLAAGALADLAAGLPAAGLPAGLFASFPAAFFATCFFAPFIPLSLLAS